MILRNDAARDFRRLSPIHAYVGANGHGKSLLAVWDCLPDLDAGRLVWSTVRLLDFRHPRVCDGWHVAAWSSDPVPCELGVSGPDGVVVHMPDHQAAHPFYRPLTTYSQLLEAHNCSILLDEITGGFSSGSTLPGAVVNLLVQLRRSDRVVRYTTPSWARTHIVIRETTQAVTLCTGYLPTLVEGRQWRSRRLFRALTYAAADMDEFSSADRKKPQKGKRVRAERFALHWGPDLRGESGGFGAYDTYAPVRSLAAVDDSGRCIRCNKVKTPERCKCSA